MRIYDPVTGETASAFTMDELMDRGLSLEESAWLVWNVPLDTGVPRKHLQSLYAMDLREARESRS